MLFIIDMQNDFIDQEKGKMKVKDSDKLLDVIIEKIKTYEERGDKIFYTLNIHEDMEDDKRSQEEKQWGQSIYTPLKSYLEPHCLIKKTYYGIEPEKASKLKEEFKNKKEFRKEIELVGVETEICLLSNAIILQNMFPDSKIIIDESLCTSNNIKLHKIALEIMKGLKMEVL